MANPSWVRLPLAVVGLAVAAFALGRDLGGRALEAAPLGGQDVDGDGLPDLAEDVLKTDVYMKDTDGDRYSDLEELARQTDPLLVADAPVDETLSVGLAALVQGGQLHLLMPVYLPKGKSAGVSFEVGLMLGGSLMQVSPQVYLPLSTVSLRETENPADELVMIDLAIPESLIVLLGKVSLYASATPAGASKPSTAAALDIVVSGGVLMALAPVQPSGFGGGSAGSSVDVVYRPLEPSASVPSSFAPGQICVQATTPVGYSGDAIVHQVTSAGCEPADDFCMPECASSVGTSTERLDPLALIGG